MQPAALLDHRANMVLFAYRNAPSAHHHICNGLCVFKGMMQWRWRISDDAQIQHVALSLP